MLILLIVLLQVVLVKERSSGVGLSKRTKAYMNSTANTKASKGLAINRRASDLLQRYGQSNYERIGRARRNMLNALSNSNG